MTCPKCGASMVRRVQAVRTPEVYMQCPMCHEVCDMSMDEYLGIVPAPEWARFNPGSGVGFEKYVDAEPVNA